MDALEAIKARYSVREYLEKEIEEDKIEAILEAGLASPSAVNCQEWEFIVVKDKATLEKMSKANGGAGEPVRKAAMAILICCDMNKTFPRARDYWVIDGAIAGENMAIAATSLGIGSCWIGTYPQLEKVEGQRKIFNLPENIIPHSVLTFGYPKEGKEKSRDFAKLKEKVHFEKF